MSLSPAPFHEDVAGGPPGGAAYWTTTADNVRIRLGVWRPQGTARGTVLMFPGRTEYIEKYCDTAGALVARGFAMLAVDWRGQGLAQRLLADRRIGHVGRFSDYQFDVAATLDAVRDLDLPRPLHLLAHSMGGCIGLRAVIDGLPVQSCAFSAPMWGIQLTPPMRAVGWVSALIGPALGLGGQIPPNSSPDNYVQVQAFAGNALTTDPEMYTMMQRQLAACPDFGLGGPSLLWLREALTEMRHLAGRPAPEVPCVTFLGSNEKIVDPTAIQRRMDSWPNGTLERISEAEHEVLMEVPEIRARIFDQIEALYADGDSGTRIS